VRTDRQTDRRKDRHTDRKKERHTDRYGKADSRFSKFCDVFKNQDFNKTK